LVCYIQEDDDKKWNIFKDGLFPGVAAVQAKGEYNWLD
jgi:hypothetical protein